MDNRLYDIDKLFRDSLEPTEETPSEKVWDEINEQLDGDKRKKPGVGFLWVKRTLLILLFIGGAFGGYYLLQKNEKTKANKTTALTKQHDLQLPPNNDSLKRENSNQENKIVLKNKLENKFTKKIVIDKILKHVKIKSTDTIATLNKANKNNVLSTKAITSINTTDVWDIADNKKHLKIIKSNSDNRQPIILSNNKNLADKNSKNKNAKSNFKNNKNEIKNTSDDLSNNNLYSLKNTNSSRDKNKEQSIEVTLNNLNPDFKNNYQRLLNAKKASFEIDSIIMMQAPIAPNLPDLETAHLSQLQLAKEPISKKAVSKKQSLAFKSGFYISVFAAPEWQGFQLQDNDDLPNGMAQNQGGDTKNKIKHREDEDASLVAGIGVGYRLSKRISIESGLRFSEYDIRTDSIKLYAAVNTTTNTIGYKINTSLGYGYLNNTAGSTPAVGDSTIARNLRQSVNYLSMPLLLRYETGKGRLSFNPGLGFVFNFILNSSIRTNVGNEQKQMIQLQGLKKIGVGMMFAPSIYYRFSNHISFGLEPYFNYTISPINKATVVDSYPYGVGLGGSIQYHF